MRGEVAPGLEIPIRFTIQIESGTRSEDVQLVSDKFDVYRVISGTGSHYDGECTEINYDSLTNGERNQVRFMADQGISGTELDVPLFGWAGFAMYVCSDTPVGVYEVNMTAYDGVGNAISRPLTVEVLDEYVPGGQIVPVY